MAWINKYLSDSDLKKIEETISRVEESTSGEIVPVIVKKSSTVGHVPLTLTLLITLLLVIVELPFSDWLWVTPWVWLWLPLLVVIYYFSHLLARFHWIQKFFVPEKDEVAQVHQRAHLEFYLNRIHRTHAGTGVLIFVSVMEKKAVVLADEGISSKLPKETWDKVLQNLGTKLHQGEWTQGFVEAIESCGDHLKTHFPIGVPGHNELKNHLIVKD
ncbi:TPM domain-containing protein [Bdellovibrio bacteriovorus]|uniref:TPM domain-containing protein n=1 Tax=Bdellovibrio bacteriovorus TaxID=959 RepID=UPI0035A5B4CF